MTRRLARDRAVDAAVQRLRRELYEAMYYGSVVADTRARRSGWVSEEAQFRAYHAISGIIPANIEGSILDLGCGDGRLLRFLVERRPGPLVAHGVDLLARSIAEARKLAVPAHRKFLIVGDATELAPEPRHTVVLSSLCYALPWRRRAYAARCRRWVARGGWLILYEYRGSPLFDGLLEFGGRLRLPIANFIRNDDVAMLVWRRRGA